MRIVSPTLPYPIEILRSLRFNISGLPLHRSYACYVFSVREGKLRLVKSRILSMIMAASYPPASVAVGHLSRVSWRVRYRPLVFPMYRQDAGGWVWLVLDEAELTVL
jgi:hypothetical protein